MWVVPDAMFMACIPLVGEQGEELLSFTETDAWLDHSGMRM